MSVILLEHPRPKNFKRFEEVVNAPLSACLFTGYIASVLQENNVAPEIINAHLYDWSIEQVVAHLSQKPPRLLCVHTVYLWETTQTIFDMLSTVKSALPATHINLYGYYPTFSYEQILAGFPAIDSITVGEPEFTTLDLAQRVLSPKDTPDEINIPGLAVRGKDGKAVFQPRPPIKDLDTLPFPVRTDVGLYTKKSIAAYIQGSRGCYNHCTFCYLNPFYVQAAPWRGRSAKNVFEEIYQLHTNYGLSNFYFSDANFFGVGKSGKDRA
ncbi:MAG: B12-binding domain-containing radical SAM protein, partial [Planctomycetota bacterium]